MSPDSARLGHPATIASADNERWQRVQQGYAAWERGEPFDKFQYEGWQEGWFVGLHGKQWNELAAALDARVLGFSHDYAATFVWPDNSTSSIDGGLLKALRKLTAQAIETRRAETGTGSVEDESAVGEADAPKTALRARAALSDTAGDTNG